MSNFFNLKMQGVTSIDIISSRLSKSMERKNAKLIRLFNIHNNAFSIRLKNDNLNEYFRIDHSIKESMLQNIDILPYFKKSCEKFLRDKKEECAFLIAGDTPHGYFREE